VEGWTSHNANLEPPNRQKGRSYMPPGSIYHIDQKIIDDYKAYIQQVKPTESDLYVDEVDFYEDGTGQHAVRIVINTNTYHKFAVYYLMYDKDNVRTKIIKAGTFYMTGC
jgi:hypothetical protein